MADLLDLANDMSLLSGRIDAFRKQTTEDVALTILSDLVQVTPVDTGTALSNWLLTVGAPAAALVPAHFPSPKGRVKRGVWEHAVDPVATAQANVTPTMDAAKAVLATKQPGQTIFITNGVSYISELDQGSSVQAPSGFVDRAIILGEDVIKHARL